MESSIIPPCPLQSLVNMYQPQFISEFGLVHEGWSDFPPQMLHYVSLGPHPIGSPQI